MLITTIFLTRSFTGYANSVKLLRESRENAALSKISSETILRSSATVLQRKYRPCPATTPSQQQSFLPIWRSLFKVLSVRRRLQATQYGQHDPETHRNQKNRYTAPRCSHPSFGSPLPHRPVFPRHQSYHRPKNYHQPKIINHLRFPNVPYLSSQNCLSVM